MPNVNASAFLQHANPTDLDAQAEELRQASEVLYLRSVEIMFLELRAILVDHPDIVQISYDQDGDTDSVPLFSCLDKNGDDIAEDIEAVDALAETWNGRMGNATVRFLSTMEGYTFHRDSFERDVEKACKKMMEEDMLRNESDVRQWKSSFTSYLESLRLDHAAPASTKLRNNPRRV